MMASVEMEKIAFIVPPLNFRSVFAKDSVSLTWDDKSYNALSFVIERKPAADTGFTQIAQVSKGSAKYVDRSLAGSTKYYYRARAKSSTAFSDYSNLDSVTTSAITGVGEMEHRPAEFRLSQNYPNPFNPSTDIRFTVERKGMTSLNVYDMLGRRIAVLFHTFAEPGEEYDVHFNAASYSSGAYLYVLQSGEQRSMKKMLLVK